MRTLSHEIYYLIHCTNSLHYHEFDYLRPSRDCETKFPGVYFSLVTKWNIDTEVFHNGDTMLLFSAELLNQKNYHLNLIDMNGIISEHNTYFPWELNKFLRVCRENKERNGSSVFRTYNEVVFHDAIPIKYLCKIIKKPVFASISNYLPKNQITNEHSGDQRLHPFCCYYDCSRYKGLNMSKHNSQEWVAMMNAVCGTEIENKDAYNERMKYLLQHRDKHNMKILYVFTASR